MCVDAKRPQRDLNPCYQDENLVSWTWLDDGVGGTPRDRTSLEGADCRPGNMRGQTAPAPLVDICMV